MIKSTRIEQHANKTLRNVSSWK